MTTQTMPDIWLNECDAEGVLDCGCKLTSDVDGTPGAAFYQCPLHAASPELLEALYAIQRGFIDGSIRWAKPRQADSDAYHPANTLMCDAIAKAEGRS